MMIDTLPAIIQNGVWIDRVMWARVIKDHVWIHAEDQWVPYNFYMPSKRNDLRYTSCLFV